MFIPTLWMSEVNVDQIFAMENINDIVAPGSMKPDSRVRTRGHHEFHMRINTLIQVPCFLAEVVTFCVLSQ